MATSSADDGRLKTGGLRRARRIPDRILSTVCVFGFCLLSVAACAGSPTGPTTSLNTEFTLAPADVMRLDGTSLGIRFNEVSGDSRCPADALCIQGGSADVRITARSNRSTRNYELRTGDMRPVQHDGLTISLVQLTPYPFSSRTIQPEEYRATLKVTR